MPCHIKNNPRDTETFKRSALLIVELNIQYGNYRAKVIKKPQYYNYSLIYPVILYSIASIIPPVKDSKIQLLWVLP